MDTDGCPGQNDPDDAITAFSDAIHLWDDEIPPWYDEILVYCGGSVSHVSDSKYYRRHGHTDTHTHRWLFGSE